MRVPRELARRLGPYGPALVGGALGLAGAAWYLRSPGRSIATGVADLGSLLTGSLVLSDAQKAIVDQIGAECTAAGLAWLAPAAIANAYAESRLDPTAIATELTGGQSVGLWQLYDQGLGAGMSVADRQDVHTAAQTVLAEARRVGLANRTGLTHAQLAGEWARLVEVCDTCDAGGQQNLYRQGLVAKLFGDTVAAQIPR